MTNIFEFPISDRMYDRWCDYASNRLITRWQIKSNSDEHSRLMNVISSCFIDDPETWKKKEIDLLIDSFFRTVVIFKNKNGE